MSKFEDRIRKARENADLTQEALAAKIGVHKFTVSKWEQGISRPGKPTNMHDLANVCDVDYFWLRDGVGEMGHYTPADDQDSRVNLRRVMTSPSNTAPVDWVKIGELVGMIHGVDPKISSEKTGKALRLLYVFAKNGQVNIDQVRDVLATLG